MSKNDGGPAFPCGEDYFRNLPCGMTLRDYFAAKAMQGELAGQNEYVGRWDHIEGLAGRAYDIADAMLKAREA